MGEIVRGIPLVLALLMCAFSINVSAQVISPAEQEAEWMLERLTGVQWPANATIVADMARLISSGQRADAAQIAMNQPNFLNITVKQMALKMSTREETIRIPFNEFAADFIGVTRDGIDARQLLTGNFFYMGDATKLAALTPAVTIASDIGKDIVGSNNHYVALENSRVDIGANLIKVDNQQVAQDTANNVVLTVNNPDPAGVLTSRTFMEAHATAGTNRRLVEYTFREFTCTTIDKWADTQAPDLRIGRDVDRYPAGDPIRFQTTCKGCHSQMDSMRGAFAKWDFRNGFAIHSAAGGINGAAPNVDANGIVRKMNQNGTVYPGGFVTVNDSWVNNAVRGANALTFGWRSPASGNGVGALGSLVANSSRFSACMAKRVFDTVCKRNLTAADQQLLAYAIAQDWEKSGYNMKKLFELVTINPRCRQVGGI
jgi:hypothetical protein